MSNFEDSERSFIALTIGPIYQTMNYAVKTRELFGASFIFSWLMREIYLKICTVNKNGRELFIENNNLLLPQLGKKNLLSLFPHYNEEDGISINEVRDGLSGMGLFPDRLIMLKDESINIESIISEVKKLLAQYILNCFKSKSDNFNIESYIDSYFQFYWIETKESMEQDFINSIQKKLDAVELNKSYFSVNNRNILMDYFNNPYDSPNTCHVHYERKIRTLNKNALSFGKNFGKDDDIRFPTISQIAAKGLINLSSQSICYDVEENDLFQLLRSSQNLKKFSKAFKYVAYVMADGDGFGNLIGKIRDVEKIKELDEDLVEFGLKAWQMIEDYGALPIYIGGDDLLFIAPVIVKYLDENDKPKNIFQLVEDIDQKFQEILGCKIYGNIGKTINCEPKTLSFGVAVSYYKYPMYEALEECRSLLFDNAKKVPGKNAFALKLIKHSGNECFICTSKEHEKYTQFIKIIKSYISPKIIYSQADCENDSNNEFIKLYTSIIHKLIAEKRIIASFIFEAGIESFTDIHGRILENYFENSFNETVHSSDLFKRNKKDIIACLKSFIENELNNNNEHSTIARIEDSIFECTQMLKFIKFLAEVGE